MKLSEQLTLLLQMEDRITALEKIIYQRDARSILAETEELAAGNPAPKSSEPTPKTEENKLAFEVTASDMESMSLTELSRVCQKSGIRANPCMDREEMILALKSGEAVEDKVLQIRHEIQHFIDKVQPSLKQILRCSKKCVAKCPEIRVVDCWTSNKNKIQEN